MNGRGSAAGCGDAVSILGATLNRVRNECHGTAWARPAAACETIACRACRRHRPSFRRARCGWTRRSGSRSPCTAPPAWAGRRAPTPPSTRRDHTDRSGQCPAGERQRVSSEGLSIPGERGRIHRSRTTRAGRWVGAVAPGVDPVFVTTRAGIRQLRERRQAPAVPRAEGKGLVPVHAVERARCLPQRDRSRAGAPRRCSSSAGAPRRRWELHREFVLPAATRDSRVATDPGPRLARAPPGVVLVVELSGATHGDLEAVEAIARNDRWYRRARGAGVHCPRDGQVEGAARHPGRITTTVVVEPAAGLGEAGGGLGAERRLGVARARRRRAFPTEPARPHPPMPGSAAQPPCPTPEPATPPAPALPSTCPASRARPGHTPPASNRRRTRRHQGPPRQGEACKDARSPRD